MWSTETQDLESERRVIAFAIREQRLLFLKTFAVHWLFHEMERRQGLTLISSKELADIVTEPKARGRKSATSSVKVGEFLFGPVLPLSHTELIVQVLSKRGKRLRVKIVRDGVRADVLAGVLSMERLTVDWHADRVMGIFGKPKRNELVSLGLMVARRADAAPLA